jgi:hypothetical protein
MSDATQTKPGSDNDGGGRAGPLVRCDMTAVLNEVAAERGRQDARWGGKNHDDWHTTAEFAQWIQDYAGWARMKSLQMERAQARRRLIQVAALAVAAIESMDRRGLTTRYSLASADLE